MSLHIQSPVSFFYLSWAPIFQRHENLNLLTFEGLWAFLNSLLSKTIDSYPANLFRSRDLPHKPVNTINNE